MADSDGGVIGEVAGGPGCEHGVFYIAEVTDDADVEITRALRAGIGCGLSGLNDDVDFPLVSDGDLFDRFVLQGDESIGHFHGAMAGGGDGGIYVGASEGDDESAVWVFFAVFFNGSEGALGVQGDEKVNRSGFVGGSVGDFVAEFGEEFCPLCGSGAISGALE